MEESSASRLILGKFKEDISQQQIDEYMSQFANLVNLVPSLKAFKWGKDVSIENLNQGFTHVFQLSFDTIQGIAEYVAHPDHVAFANIFLPQLHQILLLDFQSTRLN